MQKYTMPNNMPKLHALALQVQDAIEKGDTAAMQAAQLQILALADTKILTQIALYAALIGDTITAMHFMHNPQYMQQLPAPLQAVLLLLAEGEALVPKLLH